MKKVELVKGISSSVLGFGCAPILGSVGAKTALRALDCALDCGITHFDLARSYGYGEAEQFLGKVIKNKRSDVVLASKFGITANWKAQALKPAKPILRFVLGKLKSKPGDKPVQAVNTGAVVADRFHDRLPINGKTMRSSLEKSLKALGTDYLDYLFVHEPLETIADIDDLAATAQLLKKEGKIRAWGLAFMRSQQHLHQAYLDRFDVLQFDNSPGVQEYDSIVADRGKKANVIFSPLRGGSTLLKPAEKLNKLFDDFPQSVILCSMFNEQHLRANAALLNDK